MFKTVSIIFLISLITIETVFSANLSNVKIKGDSESFSAEVNSSKELNITDSPNLGGSDKLFNLTTTAQEFKVGALTKVNRKYILMEATSNNVKWGFNSSCNFNLKKAAFFMLPVGENTTVYLCASTGLATVIGGEI